MKIFLKIVSVIVCIAGVLGIIMGVNFYNNSVTTTYKVKLEEDNNTIFYFDGEYSYRYGPSIIRTGENTYEALFSTAPSDGYNNFMDRTKYPEVSRNAADVLTYRKSTDGGKTWSGEVLSLVPTEGTDDDFSVCDPGFLKVEDTYYCAYTSTRSSLDGGKYNHVFVAKTKTPENYKSWQKWDGKEWGNPANPNPRPIIYYHGSQNYYGIGEPSILIVNDEIYVYYTYTGTGANGKYAHQTRLAKAPFTEDWPAHLVDVGVAMNRDGAEDSMDVKYNDKTNTFFAIDTYNRFSRSARVKFCISFDGLNFKEMEMSEESAKSLPRVHNAGIAGDAMGHIDLEKDNFVCYAYQTDDGGWGMWNTATQSFTVEQKSYRSLEKATGSAGVTDEPIPDTTKIWSLTDILGNSAKDQEKSALNALKGATGYFSSEKHQFGYYQEVLCLRVDGKVNGMVATTAMNCFPEQFRYQYSDNGYEWKEIDGGKVYDSSAYSLAPGSEVRVTFDQPVTAKFIRFVAMGLTIDSADDLYCLKLAELYNL